ncbi:MAG: methyltransferase domain-containing protein [Bacteroidetes bacterium]|nr:methyltransferase domain-containing protein [Bacteroidota bacterium]
MSSYFNSLARDWDNNPITIERTKAISEELHKIIPVKNNQTALEFGAGTGSLSVALKDLFSEITLMDSSSEMVAVTNEKLFNLNIHHLLPIYFDLEKEEYSAKTFDLVFTQMSLHHVTDIEKMISKFYQLINSGGSIAIADLYKEDGSFHEGEFNGHFGFEPEELSKIMEKVGFKEISYKKCFEIIKPEGPNAGKPFPVFLMVAKK